MNFMLKACEQNIFRMITINPSPAAACKKINVARITFDIIEENWYFRFVRVQPPLPFPSLISHINSLMAAISKSKCSAGRFLVF